MKLILLSAAVLATFGLPAPAATISIDAPTAANGSFDVVVQATDLWAGRDPSTDGIISYGFDIAIGNPFLLTFDGADSGPLFDPATTEPGTDVFGAASGFFISDPVPEPLILAILHFTRIGVGSVDITISSDLSNLFQGLQFLNEPFAEPIAGTVDIADAPEPATFVIAALGLAALGIRRRKRPLDRMPELGDSGLLARLQVQPQLLFQVRHAASQVVDRLAFRVGQVSVLQRSAFGPHAHHSPRHSHYRGIVRNRVHHYRTRANLDVVADPDIAQNLGARPHHHAVAQRRMPLAFLAARTAQRHVLVQQHVIADFGGFADHHTHAMVDKKTPANGGAGMDFDAGHKTGEL